MSSSSSLLSCWNFLCGPWDLFWSILDDRWSFAGLFLVWSWIWDDDLWSRTHVNKSFGFSLHNAVDAAGQQCIIYCMIHFCPGLKIYWHVNHHLCDIIPHQIHNHISSDTYVNLNMDNKKLLGWLSKRPQAPCKLYKLFIILKPLIDHK